MNRINFEFTANEREHLNKWKLYREVLSAEAVTFCSNAPASPTKAKMGSEGEEFIVQAKVEWILDRDNYSYLYQAILRLLAFSYALNRDKFQFLSFFAEITAGQVLQRSHGTWLQRRYLLVKKNRVVEQQPVA